MPTSKEGCFLNAFHVRIACRCVSDKSRSEKSIDGVREPLHVGEEGAYGNPDCQAEGELRC